MAVGFELASPCPQPHRSSKFVDAAQLAQFVDDAMRCSGIEFAGVGLFQATYIPCVLDAGCLHAQANAKVGNLLLARVADRVQHAFDTALAEAAGHEDAVKAFELDFIVAITIFALKPLGLYPCEVELEIVRDRAMNQC